jgi:uncharacterized protein YbaP (TraB family)
LKTACNSLSGRKGKEFRMVWKIENGGAPNYLAGTAHFIPYSFKKSLRRLIGKAETVLLEGPLDDHSMDCARQYGLCETEERLFFDRLDEDTIKRINEEFDSKLPNPDSNLFACVQAFRPKKCKELHPEIEGLKPWMVFFKVWMHYLRNRGWKYSVDIEAYEIAKELGRNVHFIETIEEQIHALEGIPLECIAQFLKKISVWEEFAKKRSEHYVAGDPDSMMSLTITDHPRRLDPIVDKRDPVMFERMKPYMEKGNTIAFVGTSHIRGIRNLFEENGFRVSKHAET